MICMIYRRKRVTDGKTETARLYRGRYRLDGETKITEIPLHTPDKRLPNNAWSKLCATSKWSKRAFWHPARYARPLSRLWKITWDSTWLT